MRRSRPAPPDDVFQGFIDVVEIGAGSLAAVHRAREIGTNRLVALKLLNVCDASPRALESFERESIALGAVSSHPNIVTLYRSFLAADGRPVLVLELCHGSIADRLQGAGLPVADVVALGIKIAGALETAHRAEILHRDVKPQNILITEFGEPALADFGVSVLQSSTQTSAGLFDFTTLHAAPELLEGRDTSAATDVYGLASTLYQLIAGRAAFRGYDGESPASVILRMLRDPVRPLITSEAPSALSDLLVRAMSKDQADRPPTAAEFADELATVEVEQQWPRTQFLIRDAWGGITGLPTITRLPSVGQRPVAPTVGSAWTRAPEPATPEPSTPADVGWSTPTVSRHRAVEDDEPVELPAPKGDAQPNDGRLVVERQVIERLVFDVRPAAVEPDEQSARYPIPPSAAGSGDDRLTGAVPTWALRATVPRALAEPVSYDDRAPGAGSVEPSTTLRVGTSSLVVDDAGLFLRGRVRRSAIRWHDVLGFETRADENGRDGHLVAITRSGPVELLATRRPVDELHELAALLEAHRRRAGIPGRERGPRHRA